MQPKLAFWVPTDIKVLKIHAEMRDLMSPHQYSMNYLSF